MSTLTFYLLKDEIERPEDALKKGHKLKLISDDEKNGIQIYIFKPRKSQPGWLSFFGGKFTEINSLYNSSSGCIVFVNVKGETENKWIAIIFGAVWYQLNESSINHEFGIRTALNLIEPNSLKTVEVRRVEEGTLQEKKSQSKSSSIDDFEVDVDRILLNAISGLSRDPKIAKSVIGKDGIRLSSQQNIETIKSFCKVLLSYYQSDQYKKDYKWYGKISKEKDPSILSKLNKLLINNLKSKHPDVYFAAPEILDEWLIDSFKFEGLGRFGTFDELDITYLQQAISNHPDRDWSYNSMEDIRVHGLDLSGKTVKTWPLLNCFVFEAALKNNYYLLSRGSWFEVEKAFKESVEEGFRSIKRTQVALPKFSKTLDREVKVKDEVPKEVLSEGAYNKRVCDELGYIFLDKITPNIAGRNSGVELCDFMAQDKKLFHIKCQIDGFKSQTLSSLFMQGYVSGNVLKNSQEYREKIIAKVPECDQLLPKDIIASEYEYCFGIVSNKSEQLPFFSKISLNKTVENLRNMDYQVSICWIGVEE